MTYDKVMLEVIKHSLTYISEEMGVALRKSAYSPNIRERADHSCAVLDDSGRTIGQAEHIPVHIGSLPLGLKNTLSLLRKGGVELRPREMYFLNDPYVAGTHLNDVTVIRPVFLQSQLIGYVANKAHHVDVGGISPGSIGIKATTLDEEGVVVQPTKLVDEDRIQPAANEFAQKTRMPRFVMGDLRAQVAANLLGDRRLSEMVSKVGLDDFKSACTAILDQTSNYALSEYAKMPQGTFSGRDFLELNDHLLPIRVIISISSNGVKADFTGTARQVTVPLNAVFGVTTSAVTFAIRTLMPPDLPSNDGFNRTISIEAPIGLLVNPSKPAPVAGGNLETSQRIVDAMYAGLIKAVPSKIPAASHGSMNNIMMGGTHPETGEGWAFYETIGGGYGGRFGADGVDGIQVNMTNTLNTPIEVIEHYYPIMFETYAFRSGSGGCGQWRGGVGLERSFTAKAPVEIVLLGERHKVRPWGYNGGFPGESSEYFVRRGDGRHSELKSKDSTILASGDTLVIRTAGGGGYLNPNERARSLIERDLENEFAEKD